MGVYLEAFLGVEIDPLEIFTEEERDQMVDGDDDGWVYEDFEVVIVRCGETVEDPNTKKKRFVERPEWYLLLGQCDERSGKKEISPERMTQFVAVIGTLERKKTENIQLFIHHDV